MIRALMIGLLLAATTLPAIAVAADKPKFAKGDVIEGQALAYDGDTLWFEEQKTKVRLFGISAPEMATVPGWYARLEMDRLLARAEGQIRCEVVDLDGRKRPVGVCGFAETDGDTGPGPLDLAEAMLRSGYSVTYRVYLRGSDKSAVYEAAEAAAVAERRGAWAALPALPALPVLDD